VIHFIVSFLYTPEDERHRSAMNDAHEVILSSFLWGHTHASIGSDKNSAMIDKDNYFLAPASICA
tara:strand:+ start:12240 stop:12434 length:195 start_codon:yes stop_codon:yes gene_type:complete